MKEVYEVTLRHKILSGERESVFVLARNLGDAETKGLKAIRKSRIKNGTCSKAELNGWYASSCDFIGALSE